MTQAEPAQSTTGNVGRYRDLAAAAFIENRPTRETAATLSDELWFQRAFKEHMEHDFFF